ncbi:MAG: tetratricopeptide repeat protein [Ignavibacteriaceae bacterium]
MKLSLLSALILTLVLAGCSKKTDQYYMDLGNTSVDQKNYDTAIESYEKLVDEYPESQLAPEAIFKMATLYQNQMIKKVPSTNQNLSPEESLQRAVSLFRSAYDKYPQSSIAPKCLFLSGFIQANDQKDFNNATVTFNLFLKQYPNNELATSVKEELENMGLTPEEILQRKKMAEK